MWQVRVRSILVVVMAIGVVSSHSDHQDSRLSSPRNSTSGFCFILHVFVCEVELVVSFQLMESVFVFVTCIQMASAE